MAVNFFIGQNGKARRVRQQFVSVNGKARRVLKGYVGVNGKARLFYSATTECVEHGEAPPLGSTSKQNLFAASTPDYAIFAGGNDPNTSFSEVYSAIAYNKSLTTQNIASLHNSKASGASVSFNNRAIFAGGFKGRFMGYDYFSTVDAYDNSLTKTRLPDLASGRKSLGGTTVGSYALFAGGFGTQNKVSTVDAYNSSFTKVSAANLSVAKYNLEGTSVGNYAIFPGGMDTQNNYLSSVDVYSSSLTKTMGPALSTARAYSNLGSNGSYALVTDGANGNVTGMNTCDVYNKSLTHTTRTIPVKLWNSSNGVFIGGNIVFAGGFDKTDNSYLKTLLVFDGSLVLTRPKELTNTRSSHAATSVGNYLLVGGGVRGSVKLSSVEYFKFA